jgi:nucleoside 2-deoxyribosyltransferase
MAKVYLAGPLFTEPERAFLDDVARHLRQLGHEVFVPHEHELAIEAASAATEIFETDTAGLAAAEVIVAVVDGTDVDSGTAAELGWAAATNKLIIGLSTDMRVHKSGLQNLFVAGLIQSRGHLVTNLDDLADAVGSHRAASAPPPGPR